MSYAQGCAFLGFFDMHSHLGDHMPRKSQKGANRHFEAKNLQNIKLVERCGFHCHYYYYYAVDDAR